MKKICLLGLAGTLVFAFAGCRKHPAPPQSRNDLVLRFLHSLKNNDAASAMAQGHKLLAMEPGNTFITQIIEVQECNQAVLNAQQKINESDIKGALEILRECRRKYPENSTLPQLYAQVNQLRHTRQLLVAMERADTAEAMSSAMTAAQTGLSANMTPELQKYFENYTQSILLRHEKEQQAIKVEEKRLSENPQEPVPTVAPAPVPVPVQTPALAPAPMPAPVATSVPAPVGK